MIKRTIEVSRDPAHLTVRLRQFVIERDGVAAGSIPCEDLGVVVVDHPGVTYSHAAVSFRQACVNRFELRGIVGCQHRTLWRTADGQGAQSLYRVGECSAAIRAVASEA